MKRDPEKAAAWKRRSALKAQERARARAQELRTAVDRVRETMGKANPPRPDAAPKPKRRRAPNPGNNPTPPLAPEAKCVCGCGKTAIHNHHVLYRQVLRRRRADASDPRSCVPVAFVCHGDHHSGARRLSLKKLPDEVFDFAFEVLGPAAYDYLRRRYADDDPRLDALLDR